MRPDAFRTGWRALACVLLAAGPLAVAAPPAVAPVPREGLAARIQAWEALTPHARRQVREQMQSWMRLPPLEQAALRASAAHFAQLPPEQQAALRVKFAGLSSLQQQGWRLGPSLGAYYPRLHPLIAYVPPAEREPLLRTLHAMSPQELALLGRLAFSTPPAERDALRKALLHQPGDERLQWLMTQLER